MSLTLRLSGVKEKRPGRIVSAHPLYVAELGCSDRGGYPEFRGGRVSKVTDNQMGMMFYKPRRRMPKRTDIHSVLIIGAGPIIIGQACEFDYSGTQACKALREEGYRVILVNSNPATIMTDPEFADRTYVEPITPECVEEIIGAGNRGTRIGWARKES